MHHEVVIVGGGTGGLFTAKQLLKAGVKDVVVLESRPFVGGRVSTTRDGDGNVLFNNFAWRISEANPMMLQLCKDLDINLIKQTTPSPDDPSKGHGTCKHGVLSSMACKARKDESKLVPNRPPLSDFAAASLDSTAAADLQDRESGYAGRTSQISWPNESHGTECWFVDGGMDRIPKEIARSLPDGCVKTNLRASEVEKTESGYRIAAVQRNGNDYTNVEFTCNQVVLATPPYSLRSLSVAKDMPMALMAVHERRLGHVYAKCAPGTENVSDTSTGPDRIYRKLPDSILQQNISGDYGHGVFQAAYACDRFERVWRELQYLGPAVVKEQVKNQLNRISNLKTPPQGWDAIEEVHVRIGFVHRWHIETHVTGKTKEELSLQAITPNHTRLPGLYLVGEAFSPFQGWTEGALWTANKAAAIIAKSRDTKGAYQFNPNAGVSKHVLPVTMSSNNDSGKLSVASTPKIMIYKGLVMDVNDWYERHPGGVGPINGHAGEDVSNIFDNFHGGWPAPLATLFGLQIGSQSES